MKVLLIGSGGREHTLAWKLSQSPLLEKLFISPGNAGTASLGHNIPLHSQEEIKNFIEEKCIDLLLIGPEKPLVDGLIDYLSPSHTQNCILFGPPRLGAMLEGSKDFAKGFMKRHNIPTATYKTFTQETLSQAIDFINELSPPIVIKADGLAAGKGVVIHHDKAKAVYELNEFFGGKYGEAGRKVLIEEFLKGIEFSVFIVTDGTDYILLPEAKDYKKIKDGDRGLNTGGMGSVSPVPFLNEEILEKVKASIIAPTIKGLQQENIPYKGFLFLGLMLVENDPFLIEYNCRLGDPETQSVLPRLKSDFLELIQAIESGKLSEFRNAIDERSVVSVVLASGGYPEEYKKGYDIQGIEKCDALVFHAGTQQTEDKRTITNGGRVLAVTAYGNTLRTAQENAYKAVKKIRFKEMTFRTDIGDDLLKEK